MSDMGIPHGAGAGAHSGQGGPIEENEDPQSLFTEHEERLFGVTIERGQKRFAVAVIANRSDGDCVLHFECVWDEPINADEAEIMANALHAAVMLMRS